MKKIFLILALVLFIALPLMAKIAIYGDTRTQTEIHRQVAKKIAAHAAPITFHTGDLVHHGLSQDEYDEFHDICAPIYKVSAFYPAKGNHEKDRQLFVANFPHIDSLAYYKVSHDGMIFLVVDTTQRINVGSKQYNWLKSNLEASADSTILVFHHHPVFSSGKHGDALGLSLFLPKLYSEFNVAAVFSGHDHCYERSFYQGVYYVTTGGGGAPLYDKKSQNSHSIVFEKVHHYVICDKTGTELLFTVYDLDDRVIDSFKIPTKKAK